MIGDYLKITFTFINITCLIGFSFLLFFSTDKVSFLNN